MSCAIRRRGKGLCGLPLSPLVVLGLAVATGPLAAQLPVSRLTVLSPAGGQRGTTFELAIGGSDLDETTELRFSHAGIRAQPKTSPPRPFRTEPQIVPNRFTVTIGEDVPVGIYEARAVGRFGVSNPRAFAVGSLDEMAEKEGNDAPPQAQRIDLETTINGIIGGATDIDCFRFRAPPKRRVVVRCAAKRIDSRLEAVLILHDADGRELERARSGIANDAVIDVRAPDDRDSEYVVAIHDELYGGGGEHFYRLSVGTFPHVDAIFPPAALPGTRGRFELLGRNLPGEELTVDIQFPWEATRRLADSLSATLDGFEFTLSTTAGEANPVFLGFATAPVIAEVEPNNAPAEAQRVQAPCELVGRFLPRGDRDRAIFEAKKGDIYWIEVYSHRLGRPTDPLLVIEQVTRQPGGDDGEIVEEAREIAVVDDSGGNPGGAHFDTGSRDPAHRLVVPSDAGYRVSVWDQHASRADPRDIYRLAIRRERPDFRLFAVPRYLTEDKNDQYNIWNPLLRPGGTALIEVLAYRRDGFDGDIDIAVEGLPASIRCAGTTIGRGRDSAMLVLTAAPTAEPWTGRVRIVGRARLGSSEIVRRATSGGVVWAGKPNEAAWRSRSLHDLEIAVRGTRPAPLTVEVGSGKTEWIVVRGSKVTLPVQLTREDGTKGDFKLSAASLPPNVKASTPTVKGDATEAKIELTTNDNTPVGEFTVYVEAQGQVSFRRNPEAAERAAEEKAQIDAVVARLEEEQKTTSAAREAAEKEAAEKEAEAKAAAEAAKRAAGGEGELTAEEAGKVAQAAAEAAKSAAAVRQQARESAEKTASELEAAKEEQGATAKRVEEAKKSAAPKNVKVVVPSTAIALKVVEAPFSLGLGAPREPLVGGGKLEVPVAVERLEGFADAVSVDVVLPEGLAGVEATAITIGKDGREGTLVFEAADDAPEGRANVTVRAKAKFAGQDREVCATLPLRIRRPTTE